MRSLPVFAIVALLTLTGGAAPVVVAQGLPSIAITRPSPVALGIMAESDDFATTVLGNPWDMKPKGANETSDIDSTINVINASFSPEGIWRGTAKSLGAGVPADPQLNLLSRGYGSGVNPCCTGALHWRKNDGFVNPLNADKYHIVSVRMKLTGSSQPGTKQSEGQFAWYRDDSPTSVVEQSVFFPTFDGWRTYTFDLKKLGTVAGSWSGAIRGFRFDPTDVANTQIEIDWVRLVADPTPEKPAPSFTFQWQALNPAPGALVELACLDANGVACTIGQNLPATQGSFIWTPSAADPGPAGVGAGAYTIRAIMGSDYAALKRGDPWDLQQPADITTMLDLQGTVNQPLTNGQTGFKGATTGPDSQLLLAVPVPIDTATFKTLTFNIRIDGDITARQLQVGWITNGQLGGTNVINVGAGLQTISLDLSQFPSWTGQATAFRIDPSANVNGVPIEIGPVTLTTSGTDATIASAISDVPLLVNTAPQMEITEPSKSSGPEFAVRNFNDSWDFSNVADIQRVNFSDWSLVNGVLRGLSFPQSGGDVQVELNLNGRRIDTNKYRYMTFKFHLDDSNQAPEQQARDHTLKLAEGWAARVLWWGPGGPGVDHCTQTWLAVEPGTDDTIYTVDMATAPIETGTFEGHPACGPQGKPWLQANVTSFRFDPHESGPPLGWALDYLKLTGVHEAPTSLTIRWTSRETDTGQTPTVRLFYSPNNDGTSLTPITTITDGATSYTWDTSGIPRGTYYVVGQIDDGQNFTQNVSNAPFTTNPVAEACAPRTNVNVRSEPSGDGRLRVTVTADPSNPMSAIRFDQPRNAFIDIQNGPGSVAGELNYPLPAGTTSFTFFLRRQVAGQPSTVPFTVTDSCGSWRSLAGGGVAAPF
jgi:hypothetical protein